MSHIFSYKIVCYIASKIQTHDLPLVRSMHYHSTHHLIVTILEFGFHKLS